MTGLEITELYFQKFVKNTWRYLLYPKIGPFLFFKWTFYWDIIHISYSSPVLNIKFFFFFGRDGQKSSFGFLVFSLSFQFNWLYMLQGNLHVYKPEITSSKDFFPELQTHTDSSPLIIFPSYLLFFPISN